MKAKSINLGQSNLMKTLAFFAIALSVVVPDVAFAGLTAAQSGAQTFLTQVQPIIRIVCIIGVIFCGLSYMFEWVDNRTLFKICAGLIIIASSTEIVNLLW